MKHGRQYEINHAKKIVTVTRKFLDEAAEFDSDAFKLMMRFEDLGFRVHAVYQLILAVYHHDPCGCLEDALLTRFSPQ